MKMKNKIVYILTILSVVIVTIGFYQLEIDTHRKRIHQHLESEYQNNTNKKDEFQTHLPIIKIDMQGQSLPKPPLRVEEQNGYAPNKEEVQASLSIIDYQVGCHTNTDKATVSSQIRIGYRGNSSKHFDKKSYSIHLLDNKGQANKLSLAGMSAHNEWVLNGPFLDKTLMRNYLCYNISGEIMGYAPNVRFCEVFIDDKYQGLYVLTESIDEGGGRIKIEKTDKGKDLTGFIVRMDRIGKGDNELNNYTHYTYQNETSTFDVRYPGNQLITAGKKNYINNYISKVEKTLYSKDLWDPKKGYTQYLDINAFAEYFVINEFFKNIDAGNYSTFYYKDIRGKMKPCVWDFNNVCDNYMEATTGVAGFTLIDAPWFSQLIKDPKFVDIVIYKYKSLRKSFLSEEYLLQYIDETKEWLKDATERNNQIWGYTYNLNNFNPINYLFPKERNVKSYDEAIKQLKKYIISRGNWLDDHIEVLNQYCSESKNANHILR